MNHNNEKIKYRFDFNKIFRIIIFAFWTQMSFAGTDLLVQNHGATSVDISQIEVGQPIGSQWSWTGAQSELCRFPTVAFYEAYISPSAPSAGMNAYLDGKTYPVFSTTTPGIGWIMEYRASNTYGYQPLLNSQNEWPRNPNYNYIVGGDIKVSLIKTGAVSATAGKVALNSQTLATLNCNGHDTQKYPDTGKIVLKVDEFTVIAKTCTVTIPANATLNLGDFTNYHFPSVGSTVGNASYTISLSCDANVNLKATVSDQTNKTNTSNIVTLTPSSAAHGLGVQVFYNGSTAPLALGPDSDSAGNLNQFSIARTSSNNQTVNVPLQFKYIRTGTITAGSANAIVGLTFSYQ